ncbi:S-adenosyl-L-methionine-dependent methyltransferase [Wolfiporia cocos MD-104 SS10]|uniref:S-adenosyl-L-methionine-dependent methyltransferase n=1 Tax=Wolfiporia cocos (strain MD-104) TaxID=742152 RepID=A0A2H3J513_WOLCO|nr:S-adenosyl-L-methionine-dependent methyltransferase [Wolfiporia cocos MD-104 SS10]
MSDTSGFDTTKRDGSSHVKTPSKSHYILSADDSERERLNMQHRMLVRATGNRLILPSISLNHADRILDSGTGTGAWILDVIEHVPSSVTLQGIDISSSFFPNHDDRIVSRGNIDFSVGSITNLPEHWSAGFALVNQRCLVTALQVHEWEAAIGEVFRALRPRGWVQFVELGIFISGPVTEKQWSLTQALYSSRGLLNNCEKHIPKMLHDAGFVDLQVEEYMIPLGSWAGQVGIESRDDMVMTFRNVKKHVLDGGGFGFVQSEEEYDAAVDSMREEWDTIDGSHIILHVFYAQKPL